MARIRKAVAYRRLERPYTRVSKYREQSFIRINPQTRVVTFEMGDKTKQFSHSLKLYSNADLQIRDNALESARITTNRFLEKNLGKGGFYFKIRPYPHHVLRENPLAAGAGADRFSTGMKKSFGKPIGLAARIRRNDLLFTVNIDKAHLKVARSALQRAASKLPCGCRVQIEERK